MSQTWIQYLLANSEEVDIRISSYAPNTFQVDYYAHHEHECEYVHCLQGERNVDHSAVGGDETCQ